MPLLFCIQKLLESILYDELVTRVPNLLSAGLFLSEAQSNDILNRNIRTIVVLSFPLLPQ